MGRTMATALLLAACLLGLSQAMYSPGGPVIALDSSNLKAKLKNNQLMLVEFYAPWCGHCKALVPEYQKAAEALNGLVKVGAVDADQHKDLAGEYRIQGFPTIKVLYMEGDKIKSVDYQGGRTAKEMVTFVMEKAKNFALKKLGGGGGSSSGSGSKGSGSGPSGSKGSGGAGSGGAGDSGFYQGTDVVVLTEGNFQDEIIDSDEIAMVEFYAPWCGHCKNLKPHWIEAATELRGKVKVAAVDCTAHESVCGQYGVRGYPTLKFFGKNKKKPEDYQGGRDASSIVEFAKQKWAKFAPPPEVKELADQHVLEKQCIGDGDKSGAKRLCIVAFLPDILDSKAVGRNRYIDALKKTAEAFKDRPFGFLWLQGGQQSALENNFGVGGFGYPALVAFRPSEKKYSVCSSAFEFEHIKEWLDNLSKGTVSALPMQGNLAEVSSVTPWDGKDAAVEIEDEFSLDDIMGDDKTEL